MVTLPVSLSTTNQLAVPPIILKECDISSSPDVSSNCITMSPYPVGSNVMSSPAPDVIRPPDTVMPVVAPSSEASTLK